MEHSRGAIKIAGWLLPALALAYSCFAPVFTGSSLLLGVYLLTVGGLARLAAPRLDAASPRGRALAAGASFGTVILVALAASGTRNPFLASAVGVAGAALAATWLGWMLSRAALPALGSLSRARALVAVTAAVAVGALFTGLLAPLPVVPTFHRLEVVATGERHPAARGSEVWVRWGSDGGLAQDGRWERRDGQLVSFGAQPAVLRWSGWLRRDGELRLVAHPWSGMARVVWDGQARTVDLFSNAGHEQVLTLPIDTTATSAAARLRAFIAASGLLGTLALLVAVRLARPGRVAATAPASRALAALAYALVVGVFLVTRLPFFLDAPVVGFFRDSRSYTAIADRLAQGHAALLTMRPAAYPLAILLGRLLSDSSLGVIALQSAAALAAALTLVHAFLRLGAASGLAVAASYGILLGSGVTLFYETAVLTESLYASMLTLSAAALLLGTLTQRWPWFAVFSGALGTTVLLRPAGLYLVAIAAAVALHLVWQRAPWRCVGATVAGVGILVNALCAYNLATAGLYLPTSCAAANLVAATSTFWTPTRAVPAALERHAQAFTARITADDAHTLRASWRPADLHAVYARYYNAAFHDDDVGIRAFLLEASGAEDGDAFEASYLAHRAEIARLARDSLRARPADYVKFVWAGLHAGLFATQTADDPFYETLEHRIAENWPAGTAPADLGPAVNGFTDRPPTAGARLPRTARIAVHDRIRVWLAEVDLLGHRTAWVAALFLASTWTLLVRRGRHAPALVGWCLALYWIGATVTAPFAQAIVPRYAFPTFFVVYLAPAFLFFLLRFPGDSAPDSEEFP